MKRFLLILSIMSLLILTSGCQPKDPSVSAVVTSEEHSAKWDEIIKTNEIRIGVPSLEDSLDNSLINAFEKESGINVQRVVLPWDDSLASRLNSNEVDMLWGQLPATSDSSSMFRLSNPYFHSTMLYLANVENLSVDKTTKVGVLKHSAGQFMVGNHFDSVTVYDTPEALFFALSKQQVDCILYDDPSFQTKAPGQALHIVKETPYDLVVAFQQNDTSAANEAEKILAKIKADGTASAICLHWYQNDYIKK